MKNQRFTHLGWKDIRISKFEFIAKLSYITYTFQPQFEYYQGSFRFKERRRFIWGWVNLLKREGEYKAQNTWGVGHLGSSNKIHSMWAYISREETVLAIFFSWRYPPPHPGLSHPRSIPHHFTTSLFGKHGIYLNRYIFYISSV